MNGPKQVKLRPIFAGLVCILVAAGCTQPGVRAGAMSCEATPDANRDVVLAFYREGLVGLQPRKAFERYASADFVEHKPDVEKGTREATVAYLEELIRNVPEPRWEVIRTIAEDDLVFLHARFTPAPQAPAYAVADVFRLRDCLIVEHWDTVGVPPEQQLNPNPRF